MCQAVVVFFQAEDGIRDLVRSRGLGDVYKRQQQERKMISFFAGIQPEMSRLVGAWLEEYDAVEKLSLIHI